jgi:hypothetical protein
MVMGDPLMTVRFTQPDFTELARYPYGHMTYMLFTRGRHMYAGELTMEMERAGEIYAFNRPLSRDEALAVAQRAGVADDPAFRDAFNSRFPEEG